MQQCYDWQSNVLKFTDVNGNKYNLKFRGNKTIVHGDSATGKSLLCTMLKSYINDNNNASFKPYNADNIFIVSKDNKDKLSLQKGKLIIIDRAELILDEQMVEIINADRGYNRYLIFFCKFHKKWLLENSGSTDWTPCLYLNTRLLTEINCSLLHISWMEF